MGEAKFTPGPWRHANSGNFGNIVEGPSGKKLYAGDSGYRAVATVQACCASEYADEQEANAAANIALVAAAPEMYDALVEITRCSSIDEHWLAPVRAALRKARGEV